MASAVGRVSRLFSRFSSPHRVLKRTPAVTCVRFVTRNHCAQENCGISDIQRVLLYLCTC